MLLTSYLQIQFYTYLQIIFTVILRATILDDTNIFKLKICTN